MKHEHRWLLAGLLLMTPLLAGCNKGSSLVQEAAADESRPATVEHGTGGEASRVTLTEDAVKKIDLQTSQVKEEAVDGKVSKVIPYDAVLYDAEGDTWTYINPEPRVYVRYHITIDRITGGQAVLSDGPPTGVPVVTVGAAELFGAESEFEEE